MSDASTPDNARPDDGWTARLARSRLGLGALSFAESTVVPVPLEAVVVPLMIGHPRRSIWIALIIWLGCLAGATLFYFVGLALVDPVVYPALEALGLDDEFAKMEERLSGDSFFWAIFLVSFSPAPMQLATLGAGAVSGNFLVYIAAIALSRGVRYFGLAILAQILGERLARLHISKGWLVLGLVAALLLGWGVMQFF